MAFFSNKSSRTDSLKSLSLNLLSNKTFSRYRIKYFQIFFFDGKFELFLSDVVSQFGRWNLFFDKFDKL